MKGFKWNHSDSPAPIFGSYKAWNLDDGLCTDPESRYSAYGYGDNGADSEDPSSHSVNTTQWDQVDWASLQKSCLQNNAERYRSFQPRGKLSTLHKKLDSGSVGINTHEDTTQQNYHPRTAVIIRGWLGMEFTDDGIHNLRSMIMELALFSGAEYEVIILVDAKDTELPHPADKAGMEEFKKLHLPEEFRDIAVLFNNQILEDWYSKIDVHVAILQYFQPVQIFSRLHPEYDYIWQFEMDSRYTGHYYHLLKQAANFGKQQPRKNLWERNSYFYIPAIHGTWDEFTDQVDQSMANQDSVLGPQAVKGINTDGEAPTIPVVDLEEDLWDWGIGEEADVITWLPSFDPRHTKWPFRDHVFNFAQKGSTPRRASVVAMSRVSAHLLRLMHADKERTGLGLASEMSPTSWALYYGLKAVQVPQPIFHAHSWDPAELNRRANPGSPGAINAGRDSIWSWNMHNDILLNVTFMFNSEFSERLYRAWLGYDQREDSGKICLPPMLLHPVKNTKN
ncbi:hypothetical protein N7454_006451 [Penicillium verhagenii]|nr:hypothetical protein N7454_006451 [Penicillium verhagenii]